MPPFSHLPFRRHVRVVELGAVGQKCKPDTQWADEEQFAKKKPKKLRPRPCAINPAITALTNR